MVVRHPWSTQLLMGAGKGRSGSLTGAVGMRHLSWSLKGPYLGANFMRGRRRPPFHSKFQIFKGGVPFRVSQKFRQK